MTNQTEVTGIIRIDLKAEKALADLRTATAEQKKLIKAMQDISTAKAAARSVAADIKTIGTNAEATTKVLKSIDQTIAGLDRSNAILSLAKHFAEVGKSMNEVAKQGEVLKATLKEIGASDDEIGSATKAFASFSGGKSPTANPKLSASTAVSSVSGIGRGVGDLVSGDIVGGIQSIATASAQAAPALTAAGVGLGTIGAAALIALPALLFVADAIKKFANIIQTGQDGIDNGIAQVTIYNQALLETSEQIKVQVKAKQDEAKVNEGILKTLNESIASARSQGVPDVANPAVAKRDELQKSLNTTYSQLNGLNDALNSTSVAANDAAEALKKAQSEQVKGLDEQAQRQIERAALLRGGTSEGVKSTLATIGDQIRAFSDELVDLQVGDKSEASAARIEELKKQIADLSDKSRDLSINILPVIKAREDETEAARKQAEALANAAKAADLFAQDTLKLRDLDAARQKQLTDQSRAESRNRQITSIEAQISAAKQQEAEQERAKKVVSLREKAGQDELASARKYADEVSKVNSDFMENELKELASYRKEEARAQDTYATERRRKLEDLNDSLSELASKGDVAGFVRAQRAGNVDLRRGAEDFSTESRQRAEDFSDGIKERQRERETQLAELQQQFVQERAVRQQNLQEQLATEAEAGKQRVLRSAQLEQELAKLKEQFAAEDNARTLSEQKAAYERERKALLDHQKEQAAIILKATDPVVTSAKNLVRSVGDELNRAIANLRAGAAMARPASRGGGGTVAMNADGGIYTKPTLGLLGEKKGYGDVVLPFKQSEGIGASMQRYMQQYGQSMGGAPVIVNITTGSVATQQDIADVKSGVVQAVHLARQRGA